jgi:hypothetical protein
MLAMRRAAMVTVAVSALLVQMPGGAVAQEARTLKERLSDKASDNQRVDNCRVPAERRGLVPRPDCPAEPHPLEPAVEAGVGAPKAQ